MRAGSASQSTCAALALAEWAAGFDLAQAPAAAVAKAKDHLLDFIGVALAGAREEASGRAAAEYARALGGAPMAALLGCGPLKVPSESAAFASAVAGHSIEMDDVHNASSLHPGVVSIPPALAVAEERGASGADLLAAIIVAYEIVLRVGEAANPSKTYKRGFHPTAVCGVFSSAAAAARLMKLSPAQTAHALGLAWSFAAGNMSFQTEGSWAKRMQAGGAARAGIMAARLAGLGATGPLHVFGPHGFFHAYSGERSEMALLGGLGESLKILECGIKPFGCCRYNQGPIDLLLSLRAEKAIDPESIEKIEIEIASTGLPLVAIPAEAKRAPASTVEAQFSIYHSAAVALLAGAAGSAQYREPWISDARVRALAARVTAGSSPELDRHFPKLWPARVRIRLRDGSLIERETLYCLGDPEKPMTGSVLEEKFLQLAGNSTDAARVIAAIRTLEDAENLTPLVTALNSRLPEQADGAASN